MTCESFQRGEYSLSPCIAWDQPVSLDKYLAILAPGTACVVLKWSSLVRTAELHVKRTSYAAMNWQHFGVIRAMTLGAKISSNGAMTGSKTGGVT